MKHYKRPAMQIIHECVMSRGTLVVHNTSEETQVLLNTISEVFMGIIYRHRVAIHRLAIIADGKHHDIDPEECGKFVEERLAFFKPYLVLVRHATDLTLEFETNTDSTGFWSRWFTEHDSKTLRDNVRYVALSCMADGGITAGMYRERGYVPCLTRKAELQLPASVGVWYAPGFHLEIFPPRERVSLTVEHREAIDELIPAIQEVLGHDVPIHTTDMYSFAIRKPLRIPSDKILSLPAVLEQFRRVASDLGLCIHLNAEFIPDASPLQALLRMRVVDEKIRSELYCA